MAQDYEITAHPGHGRSVDLFVDGRRVARTEMTSGAPVHFLQPVNPYLTVLVAEAAAELQQQMPLFREERDQGSEGKNDSDPRPPTL